MKTFNNFLTTNYYFTESYKLIFYRDDIIKESFLKKLFSLEGISKITFLNNSMILFKKEKTPWNLVYLKKIIRKDIDLLNLPHSKKKEVVIGSDFLDLRKTECPFSYIKLMFYLKKLKSQEKTEVILSSPRSFENISSSIDRSSFSLELEKKIKNYYYLLIKKL